MRSYLRSKLLDSNTVRQLQATCNDAILAHLPPRISGYRHKVAIDLTYIPYHGQAGFDANEIRRGQAKSGTTHFHCYATAYVIKKNKRVTLAVYYVQAEETMPEVLEWLLTRLNQIDVAIKRLYLDKQFYNVAVISHLQTHHPRLSVIIPVIVRGKYGGTRALVKGRKSYNTTYTMHSADHGQATFRIAVVCKYSKERYLRRGIAMFAYALLGPGHIPLHQVYCEYRYRFGIEATYRLLNKVRARTTSRNPKLRLLYVAIALMLVNIWVYLKWNYLACPRRGGRKVWEALFPLSLFKQFLLEAIKNIYGAVCVVSIPKTHCLRAIE